MVPVSIAFASSVAAVVDVVGALAAYLVAVKLELTGWRMDSTVRHQTSPIWTKRDKGQIGNKYITVLIYHLMDAW